MAQYPGVPWSQRPDYVALTQRVDPTGNVTAYNPPRPGVSATDVTSFVFGQAGVTAHNWPEPMYYLQPTPEWIAFRGVAKPPQKVDANGQLMFERFPRQGQPPRPLLDFQILPDTICSEEELWWIELWRRMDPRIHWQDIFMRVEVSGRTAEADRKLQNSTNNLINRQEHRRFFMLSWHTTGANRTTRNVTRNMVLDRVANARPPLPPNSTRGLTPGLINPRLGNVPGNSIPFPPLRGQNVGRLRVLGRPRPTRATAAVAANPGQGNPVLGDRAQKSPVQHSRARGSRERGYTVPTKRNRASPGRQGRSPKRRALHILDDTSEDYVETRSEGTKSSEDMSLTDINARPQTQKRVRPSRAAPKIEQRDFVRGKGPLARVGKAKTTKRPYSTIESRESTTDIEPEHQEDHSEHPAGQIYREGDPGFEAAYRASIMARRRRQEGGQPHRQVHHARQYVPDSPPTRRTPQDDVSDAELLGYSEDRTSVAPYTQSNAFPAPRVPAPPRNPANSPTPPPRPRRRNPMTGLLFEPLHRRPEALSGYSDTPVRSRGSSVRSSRVAPSTTVHAPEDNYGRAGATRTPNTGFPVNPDNRPPQTYYERSPGGSYYHDDDGSETPIGPTSSPGVSFTETRPAHGHIQRINRAPYPSRDAQITTRHSDPINDPINDPTNQGELAPDHRVSRPPEGTRRYEDLSLAEIRRARALREMITGFVGQDDERVRRKKQGSTDDDE